MWSFAFRIRTCRSAASCCRKHANCGRLPAVFLAALLAAGCGGGGESGSPPQTIDPYVYEVPPQRNDGWLVSGLETEGIDQQRLVGMMEFIYDRRDDEFLRNVLVVRNNRLVFEEYFGTTHVDSLSHLQSATKSIVSAIYGVALSNGHAGAPDDTLFMYFPEYQHLSTPDKENIRIRDVLSMSPGFDWNEGSVPTLAAENDNLAAYRSGNSIRYVLEKEVVAPPGSVWNYNSGCPMLLAGVVRNQSGMHLDEYGDLYLFGPLGITAGRWEYQSDGLPLATGGLWIRSARGTRRNSASCTSTAEPGTASRSCRPTGSRSR